MSDKTIDQALLTTSKSLNLFGRAFPKRELELGFPRSPTSKRVKKPETSISSITRSLRELGQNNYSALEKIKKDLYCLNAYPVSYKQRMELTVLYWKHIYTVAMSLNLTYSKQGIMPDDRQRAQLLDLCGDNLRLIRRSYELLFMHDYSLPNWRYGKARAQIFESSFRIMEIVHLELQLAALRYRPLSAGSWQSLNKIFYIMDAYEHVEFEQVLTQSVIQPGATKKYGTIRGFYLRVQLAGYFDLLHYPTQQQKSVDSYIAAQSKAITVYELETGAHLDGDTFIISSDQDHAPRLHSHFIEQKIPGKVISIKSLKSNIATLLGELIDVAGIRDSAIGKTSGLREIPKNFASQLYLMHDRISDEAGDGLPFQARQATDILLYCGFKECFELKVDDQRPPEQRRVLAEALAERSSFIGEDQHSEANTLWHKLFSDSETILLQTEETRYSIQMSVGWITAYSFASDRGRLHTIATVSRLERLGNNLINVELKIIADHAEAVRFIDPNAELENATRRKCPAFLLEESGQWKIILHASHYPKRLVDIHLLRNGKVFELTLGKLQFASQEFLVFGLLGSSLAYFDPLFKEAVAEDDKLTPDLGLMI